MSLPVNHVDVMRRY